MHPDCGLVLLTLARGSVSSALGIVVPVEVDPPWLAESRACFVTLTKRGRLRGCVGSLTPIRSLGIDVRENARAAAFADPRFPPVTAEELDQLRFEVSVLSDLVPMDFRSEEEAVGRLNPGMGLVLETGWHRGTFLPQVWEQLPDPVDFLAHLKLKAGLSSGFWDESVKLFRYTVEKWKES